jgi:hypothetical protein
MMVRQLVLVEGETQASSVKPFTRFSEAALLTVTQLLVPLNDTELPYLPVVQAALDRAPVLL